MSLDEHMRPVGRQHSARWYGGRAGGAAATAALIAWRLSGWRCAAPWMVLAGAMLRFFRDPARATPTDPELIVSPADGRISAVESIDGGGFGTRITIFLSLLDVHVTRAPIGGRVASVRYRPGRLRNAMRPSAIPANERNEVRIEGDGPPLRFAQVAGLIARRIVFWPVEGERVERGQRVGLIMFGSGVEVALSARATVLVRPGQRVRGGVTALARYAIGRTLSEG